MTWAYEVLEEALADIANECRLATCSYGALTAVAFFWLYPTRVHWQVTNELFDIKSIGTG